MHNDFLNKNTYKSEEITKKCKAIITNSEYIKQCVLTIKGINAENVFINKNCLDNDNFLEIDEKTIKEKAKEYSIDLSKKNIIFVGRIVPQKGIKELICATQLISKNIDWNLIIVGSKWFGKTTRDKFGKELKEIAKKNINRIKFMGFIAAKEVKFLYKMADVVVVPSIWEEPAGRVVLEAQSVGTPVILSDAGGMKEYTTPNASMIIKRGKDFER